MKADVIKTVALAQVASRGSGEKQQPAKDLRAKTAGRGAP